MRIETRARTAVCVVLGLLVGTGCGSGGDGETNTGVIGSSGGSAGWSGASGSSGSSQTGGTSGSGGSSASGGSSVGGASGSRGDSGSGGTTLYTPCNLNSGYMGDELCMPPPDPSQGFQLHYGPDRYDDPAALGPYLIPPGQELTDCFYLNAPNNADVFFYEYHSRVRPGAYSMFVSMLGETTDGLSACNDAGTTGYIEHTQSEKRDFPDASGDAPENAALGTLLPAHAQTSIQLHFFNPTSSPMLREAWVNVLYKDPTTVTTPIEGIQHIAGLAMSIPAGSKQIVTGTAVAPADLRVISLQGLFHSHTLRFTVWKTTAQNRSLLYEAYDWHNPGELRYDSVHINPPPDAISSTTGGFSGVVQLAAGDKLDWECEIDNTGGTSPLTYGNDVFTSEMCALFGSYGPSFGSIWQVLSN